MRQTRVDVVMNGQWIATVVTDDPAKVAEMVAAVRRWVTGEIKEAINGAPPA